MAFPTTVSTLISTFGGVGGPFISSAGAVYLVTRSSTTNQLHMFKASDPTSAWAGAGTDFTTSSGNTIRAVAAYQVGDNIHVVTRDADIPSNTQLRYHVFSMASDGWTVTNEAIKGVAYTTASLVDASAVMIVVRTNGDVIVGYEGPQVVADIARSRTYYARRVAGVWTVDIALDNGGNFHWAPSAAVLGSNDRTHFFINNYTNGALHQRTLTSANSLEAMPAAFDSAVILQDDVGLQRGCAYSISAGGTMVKQPYYNSFSPDVNDVNFTSVDVPVPNITLNLASPQTISTGIRRVMSYAPDGAVVWDVFVDVNLDLYVHSSNDNAAWTAPSLIYTGSASEVYTSIYVRNSAKVIGIAFKENDLKYTEYTISAAAVTQMAPMGLLMGVGR